MQLTLGPIKDTRNACSVNVRVYLKEKTKNDKLMDCYMQRSAVQLLLSLSGEETDYLCAQYGIQ